MFDDLYQEIILDHYKNPRNKADLKDKNIPFLENPTCGDSVRVFVSWDQENRAEKIIFEAQACAICTASASMMTQILQGKTRDELTERAGHFIAVMRGEEPEDLADWGEIEALRGVIQLPARVKCATLAWHALEPEKNT